MGNGQLRGRKGRVGKRRGMERSWMHDENGAMELVHTSGEGEGGRKTAWGKERERERRVEKALMARVVIMKRDVRFRNRLIKRREEREGRKGPPNNMRDGRIQATVLCIPKIM